MKLILTILFLATTSFVSAQETKRRPALLRRADTREAERRLAELGYWTGAIDGLLDPATRSALIAFQKWEGRPITVTLNWLRGKQSVLEQATTAIPSRERREIRESPVV